MKQFVGNFFEWLLRASWQAAIIVLLVLAIQWLFRKKLSERWRYALWSLVLFRLLLPTTIPSNLSLYNLTRLAPTPPAIQPKPVATANTTSPAPAPVPEHAITPAIQIELPAPPQHPKPFAVTPPPKPTSHFTKSNLLAAASLIWLAGALLLLSRILVQNILFSRRLRHSKTITDTTTLDLFQDCKNLFGITFPIRLLETSAVRSPALYGFFRPVLLLPSELLSNFTTRELRYIFLHELAHVKRRDMAVHWAATILGLLHWFNPVLWFAFRRMATDRELACDELALSYANEQESKPYGETIIKLLESCAQTAALPGLMGILEDKDQMTRRISMIARFKKHSRWSLPAILLLLLLGIFTLTDAQSPARLQLTGKTPPKVSSGTNTPLASSESPIKFQLLEVNGEPIVNARIQYSGARPTDLKTDTNGIIEIPGALGEGLSFSMKGATTSRSGKVPKGYVMRLIPAIEGILVDETQKPVVGAKVEFHVPQNAQGQNANISLGTNTTVYTDANGHWFRMTMPTNLDSVDLSITHSNYPQKLISLPARASTNYVISMQSGPQSESGNPSLSTNEPAQKMMRFRVIDNNTGQPMPGVTVKSWVKTNLLTDSAGTCLLPLPTEKNWGTYSRITISKDGYVARYISWSRFQKDEVTDIPTEYSAHMDPAATIGGYVRNAEGQGIPHVKLVFTGPSPAGISDRERTTIMGSFHTEVTDENGRWTCSHVPKNFAEIDFRCEESNYVSKVFGVTGSARNNDVTGLSEQDYRSTNVVMTLQHGVKIPLLIVDPAGNPVTGVRVAARPDQYRISSTLTNNPEGRLQICNNAAGELTLTLQGNGVAAQTIKLTISNNMPELKITMAKGKALRGKVVNESGEPLAGVEVTSGRINYRPAFYQWTTRTDEQGHFTWDSAPVGSNVYEFTKFGYERRTEVALTADDEEQTITLHKWTAPRSFILTGKVTDATTGKPIPVFSVEMKEFEKDGAYSPFHRVFQDTNGVYSLRLEAGHRREITIKSSGYLPQGVNWPEPAEGTEPEPLNFALKKTQNIWGKVLLPDGTPASRAEVTLGAEESGAFLGDRHFMYREQSITTDTSPDGSFYLDPAIGAHTLYVAHDTGFAQVDLEDVIYPITIKLRPWGRIEGTLLTGGKPAAKQQAAVFVPFSAPFGRGLSLSSGFFTVETDSQGKFVFEHVPPVEVSVCRMIPKDSGSYFAESQFVEVQPGATTNVVHNPIGRLITGQFVTASSSDSLQWTNQHEGWLSKKMDNPTYPKSATPEATKEWARHYWKSPEGKAYTRARQNFIISVSPDGTFKMENVPPGTYNLSFDLFEAPKSPEQWYKMGRRLASLHKEVTIPASENGNPTQPFDLGKLEVEEVKILHQKETAPDFETKTLDGKSLKLSDLKGKYVLLDFWATWCGPCVAETPHLKETYDAFKNDPRFTMVGLSLDKTEDAPRDYSRTNSIAWTQCFLGDWSKTSIPKSYGVEGIPAVFLIGPDGKILATDLRGDSIRKTIAEALSKK